MSRARFFSPGSAIEPVLQSQQEERVFPGLRGELKRTLNVSDGIILPKGTSIIIQPLNLHKPDEIPRFKLTTFVRKTDGLNNELPESQRTITAGPSYEVRLESPQKFLVYKEGLLESNEPLFSSSNAPDIQDVQQSQFPDCYLLSAIQSILNHPNGKAFIREMMKDNGDGTVTVRLADPETGAPRYILVSKAMHVNADGALNLHKELWLHVLENAYIALGKHSRNLNVDQSSGSVFGMGDQPWYALFILTGLKNQEMIQSKALDNSLPFLVIDDSQIEQLKKQGIRAIMGKEFSVLSERITPVASSSEANPVPFIDGLIAYYDFYVANRNLCDLILKDNEKKQDVKIADLIDLVNSCPSGQQDAVVGFLATVLNSYIKPREDQTIDLPTGAFSGFYIPAQMKMFNAITEALARGCLVNASSQEGIKALEQPGLRGNHAYTVLDVFSRDENVLDQIREQVVSRPVYYVKLRNPWGSTGRVYEPQTFNALEEKEADIFSIELSEFYQNFHNVTLSHSANFLFAQADMVSEMKQLATELYSDENTTLEKLLAKHKKYEDYAEKRLMHEQMHMTLLLPDDREQLMQFFDTEIAEPQLKELFFMKLQFQDACFPFYSGDKTASWEQIYNLSRLEWLEARNADPAVIQELKTKIIDESKYSFIPMIRNSKASMDILSNAFARQQNNKIQRLEKMMAGIYEKIVAIAELIEEYNGLESDDEESGMDEQYESDIEERGMNDLSGIPDFNENAKAIQCNYDALIELSNELSEVQSKLLELGIPVNEEQLSKLNEDIRLLPERMVIPEIKELLRPMEGIASEGETVRRIDSQDAKHISGLDEVKPKHPLQSNLQRKRGILARIAALFAGISHALASLTRKSPALDYHMAEGSIDSPLRTGAEESDDANDEPDIGESMSPKR